MHISSQGVLRPAFIQRRQLINRELSVWRLSGQIADLIPKMRIPANNKLGRLHAAAAGTLRGLQAKSEHERAFCVLDDTRTDALGGRDPDHAIVAPCRVLNTDPETVENLVNLLLLSFRKNVLWPA